MAKIRDWAYNYNSVAGTSLQVPMPDYREGDLLVAVLTADTGSQTWTLAGWTQLLSVTNTPNLGIMWKIAGASEVDPTFAYNVSETANGVILAIMDADIVSPFGDYDSANSSANREAMPTSVSIRDNSLILWCWTHGTTAVIPSVIEGAVNELVAKDGSAHADGIAWGFQAIAGNTPTVYRTVTGTTYNGSNLTLVINSANAAYSYNGNTSTYTDEDTDLSDAGANDVVLPPIQTSANGDAIYFGKDWETFEFVKMNIGTAGNYSGFTLQWQYWNGAWTELTVTDPSSFFTVSGISTVTFTAPVDWVRYAVNSRTKYWIRCVVTARATPVITTAPLLTQGWVGYTRIQPYCASDPSVYVDPIHGVTAFKGNTAYAATATTYFGTRIKRTTLAITTAAAKTDYGINSFRSVGFQTGPTTANTWQGGTLVLLDANRPNITGKNVLIHIMPYIPADLQTVYDVGLGKGVAIGMWSADSSINSAISYNANTATYTDETVDMNDSGTNDVLTPPMQITTLGDALYIGADSAFNGFKVTVGTASSKTGGTLQWQYWNGSAWTLFTPVVDPSAFLQTAGTHYITFYASDLTGWTSYSVFSTTKYWIRCVVTVLPTAIATAPLITQGWQPNYNVWHVHGFNTPWGSKIVPAIIHPSNTTGLIDSQGTLDITLVKGMGTFVSGFLVSSDWGYTMWWVLDTTVVAGGNPVYPVTIADIVKAVADGHERMSAIVQGNNQMLLLQPIQLGDGGTNPVYLLLDSTAIEFPRQYDADIKQVFYCSIDNVAGITYYAGANDTIIHRNSIISSPSKYHWKIHASSSTSATYDFNGLVLIGAGTIQLRTGISLAGITFQECSEIDAIGATLDNCIVKQSTSTYALTVDLVAEMDEITNCQFNNNTRAIKITTAGTYTFDNITFSGNTYDIENSSAGAVIINCINGSNPSTSINTGGGSVTINNSVTLQIIVSDSNGSPIQDAQTAIYLADSPYTELMNEDTLITGIAEATYNYSTAVNVIVRVRKSSSGTTRYVPVRQPATITSSGLTMYVTLTQDNIASV